MRKLFVIFMVLVMLTTLLSVAGCPREAPDRLVGKQAPDFIQHDLTGSSMRLSDLRGSVVLLNFWASWCPPCREEIPSLVRLHDAMTGKKFRMVTIAVDEGGAPAVEKFFRKQGLRLPTIADPEWELGRRYGVTGIPETFIIDKEGVIRKRVIGPLEWDEPSVIKYLDDLASI